MGLAATDRDVTGRVSIRNSAGLRSLEGLDALEALEALDLFRNPDLTTLAGLRPSQPLQRLHVADSALESLDGAEALAPIEVILQGTRLRDLSGLDAQRSRELTLSQNPLLSDLQGARMPERLESLTLRSNERLESVRGLEGLREVGSLVLHASPVTSLEGLQTLERVESLSLSMLRQLDSLRGLEACARRAP